MKKQFIHGKRIQITVGIKIYELIITSKKFQISYVFSNAVNINAHKNKS